jgi:surface antigen
MRIKTFVYSGIIATMLATSACSQNGGADGGIRKEDIGTLGGAVGGAWIGSNVGKGKGNIVGIAAGTLLGAYLGNQVGASLDRADMSYYNNTAQRALESSKTGSTSTWTNPDSGNSGTITPTRTFQTAQGEYCREYTQTISIGGKQSEGYGRACRQPDGSWKIQNN